MTKKYDFVYVDFDDTILRHGNIDPDMVSLLAKMKMQGSKIILLTLNEEHLMDMDNACSYSQFQFLVSLFNRRISVDNDTCKSWYIANDKQIFPEYYYGKICFIDDSFAERSSCAEICDVFSPDVAKELFS